MTFSHSVDILLFSCSSILHTETLHTETLENGTECDSLLCWPLWEYHIEGTRLSYPSSQCVTYTCIRNHNGLVGRTLDLQVRSSNSWCDTKWQCYHKSFGLIGLSLLIGEVLGHAGAPSHCQITGVTCHPQEGAPPVGALQESAIFPGRNEDTYRESKHSKFHRM